MDLFLIAIEEEGGEDKVIIYRPLVGLAFVGNRKMADLATEMLSSRVPFTANTEANRFLTEIGFQAPDTTPYQQRGILSTAVLLLTNRCQLRCTYCYAAAGELAPASLSVQSGKAVIDYAARQADENHLDAYRVDFHGGGEPTLEWAKLQELTAYARSRPVEAKVSVTSNAVWSESQSQWLAENIDQISVSMDGSPRTQDRNRPLASGQPSSPVVLRSLQYLDDHKANYGVRMTVQHPWDTFPGDIQYILENTGCRSIQVEPAFNNARGEHCPPGGDQYQAFVDVFIDAYSLAKDHQARITFSGARPELITDVFCSSPYEALVVNPENQIVACYEINHGGHPFAPIAVFGRVDHGQVMVDWQAREKFTRLAQERLDTCQDCFCRWHCAGDCFTRAFSTGENGHLAKNQRCFMNQALTRFKLLDLIASGNGVWKKFQFEEKGSHG